MDLELELTRTLARINEAIVTVEAEARRREIPAVSLVNQFGISHLTPLLAAKAQVLHSLVLLKKVE